MLSLISRAGLTAVALLAGVGVSPVQAAPAKPRAYEFDVSWSMFPDLTIATGRFVLSDDEDRYLMGLEARARLTAPPIDWHGELATEGARSRDGRKPTRFQRSSVRPSLEETIIVSWDGENRPVTAVSRSPLTAMVERDRVDPSSVRDVVDPLTFLASVLDKVESTNGESCDVAARTWDGQRLADIQIQTENKLRAARVDCRIVYKDIQGLRKDTPWRMNEETTSRVARFEKIGGVWTPKWILIEAEVLGFHTTFTTNIRPLE